MVSGKPKFRPHGCQIPGRNFGLKGTNNKYNFDLSFLLMSFIFIIDIRFFKEMSREQGFEK